LDAAVHGTTEASAAEEGDGAAVADEASTAEAEGEEGAAGETVAAGQEGNDAVDGEQEVNGVTDEALVAKGIELYHAQYCGICHELAAAETAGIFGPAHDGVATSALDRLNDPRYNGTASTAAEYIRESLLDPGAYIVEGYVGTSHAMPPYTFLSEEDVSALVAFLLTQK
jgi:mono/diheme cytochrome c family protein